MIKYSNTSKYRNFEIKKSDKILLIKCNYFVIAKYIFRNYNEHKKQ